jgi:cold shock CspA family protein
LKARLGFPGKPNKAGGQDRNGQEPKRKRGSTDPNRKRRVGNDENFHQGDAMERQIGTFYSWNERGYAMIFVTPKQRYFMHVSEFDSDKFPIIGQQVSFEIAPPRKPGQLPCAVNVKPVVATSAPAGEKNVTEVL